MKTKMHKFFWSWEFDKEEQWLNEQAARGLVLVSAGVCTYVFEDCEPGAYQVRIELLNNTPGHAESQRYIRFVEDTGAEYIGSIMRWVYFRKPTAEGEFRIFSDNRTRIKHLDRILGLLAAIILIEFAAGLPNLFLYLTGVGDSFNLGCALPCLLLGLLIGYGFLRIRAKKQTLKKAQQLFE